MTVEVLFTISWRDDIKPVTNFLSYKGVFYNITCIDTFEGYKQDAEEMEFPNPAEGIDEIYVVTDGIVTLRMESPRPEIRH